MEQATTDGALFGFLTVVDAPGHGLFGGYLVVDARGRPVEFLCTAPLKVTRAQQILYGATLHGHLHGEQVGGTLLAESECQPLVVLTDVEPLLAVRSHTTLPVALVKRPEEAGDAGFSSGGVRILASADDEPLVRERLAELAAAVDVSEPFERIRLAIEEAQRMSSPARAA
ncbi:hypothetical protein EBR04_01990 [bacterium]|nr:hypothetical protein [bacterium]